MENTVPASPVPRNIVIGVDDSTFSEYAFNFYMDNVKRPGDNIILVHVPELNGVVQAPALLTDPSVVAQLIKEEEAKTKELVQKYSTKMKEAGLGGKMKQMTGKVGESIVEAAKEESAVMIIVGTRGMGKMRRTFLGSVSDYCVHHSPVPVMVCRHKDLVHEHHH